MQVYLLWRHCTCFHGEQTIVPCTVNPKLLLVCWSKTFRPNNNYKAMKVVKEIRVMEITIQ